MITAIFNPGDKSITTEKLLQWDYGQVLSIKGLDLPKAVEIHFCVYTDSTTITTVGITTDDHTDVGIPDGLLQQERELRAYVYVADLEQGKTVRTVNIPIQSRQKPEIPHTPEDIEVFRKAIKAVNNSADRAETAANTSEQNAKKTAEDLAAIAEMVETVSGIEQQVQDVKEYAGQAETAASNAALSEQKAKESETAALQAKADVETAKGSAETAAGQTAEDRTAVERAKEEVLQAKQQVSADRAAVEAVQRKVAQMGNAIPQAVLEGVQAVGSAGAAEKQGIVQAGTEQKSAVESAGTKTIEDINLAKKTATDAVETAKTGAVGAIGTAGTEQTQNVTAEGAKQVKAVENKGNEVLQSIPEDFTAQMKSKLDKQQGVENKGKALVVGNDGNVTVGEVQSGGGDGIAIINTMSGESPLVIPDSAERVNKRLELGGKTEQVQTTGVNLFDEKLLLDFDSENYDKTQSGSGFYYYKFPVSGTVTVSTKNANKNGEYLTVGIKPDGSDKTWLSHGSATISKYKTLTPEDGNIYLGVNNNLERVKSMIQNTGGIIINEGSVAKPYEPYTGGKPSPSPDYPQEIKNVGKWNEEKRKYEVDVRVTGKNIFNTKSKKLLFTYCILQEDGSVKSNVTNNYFCFINITDPKILDSIKNGQTITFSIDKGIPNKALTILISDENRNQEKSSSAGESSVTMTVSGIGKVKKLELRFNRNSTRFTDKETIVKDLMLCFGESTQYQPYSEQTLTLTSDRPITKWDKLVEQGGQIGWLYKSKTATITGKEHYSAPVESYYSGTSTNMYTVDFGLFIKGGEYCNRLQRIDGIWDSSNTNNIGFTTNVSNQIHIRIYNSLLNVSDNATKEEKVAAFKTYLMKEYENGNPYIVIFQTKDTEFVPLPQSEQNAIRALKTYYPTTVITVDGGEVDSDIEVTYIADTKNYIDQKIAPVVKTILETQKALL